MNKGYFLVTNSNKLTWKKDEKLLFLGIWCFNYHQTKILEKLNYDIAEPYGILLDEKIANYELLKKLKIKIINILSIELNKYHKLNYDNHFWKIILGNWVERYITIIINRYNSLKKCIEKNHVASTILFTSNEFEFIPNESNSIVFECNSDKFNSYIYKNVLDYLQVENLKIEFIDFQETTVIHKSKLEFEKKELKTKFSFKSLKRVLINKFFELIIRVLSKVKQNKAPLIIRPYLPFAEAFKLHLKLFAIPREWKSPQIEIKNNFDLKFRNEFKRSVSNLSEKNLENFVIKMIPDFLPMCFLENFNTYYNNSLANNWPKYPKFIFTSNCFDTDEFFKIWAAKKKSEGTPLYIGQHGNNYGTYKFMSPSNEEDIADKFITWGWINGNEKYKNAFIFKTLNIQQDYDKNGYLLLIENPLPNKSTTWDTYHEYNEYWKEQIGFVTALNNNIQNKLVIRLHIEYLKHDWYEVERWEEINKNLIIDTGKTPLHKLISKSRLVVHSYDSTGILETLSMNIPTMAFWNSGFDNLNEDAIKYYQILKDAGIIYFNYSDISSKIISIWDNVNDWWFNEEVQNARKLFCEQYARTINKPLIRLKTLLEN